MSIFLQLIYKIPEDLMIGSHEPLGAGSGTALGLMYDKE